MLFGDPELRRVAAALHDGLRGGESAIARRRLGRLRWRPASGSPVSSRAATTWWCSTTRARSAWRPALGARRRVAAATWTPRAPRTEALERAAVLADACSGVLTPDRVVPARRGSPATALRAVAPGIDPLDPRNLELEPRLPGRVVRQPGRGPRPPVRASRRWSSTAGTTRTPRSSASASRARRSPASSSCWPRSSTRPPRRPGARRRRCRTTRRACEDVLLLTSYEPLGSLELGALQHLARVVLELSIGEGSTSVPARRCGSGRRWWAAGTGACQLDGPRRGGRLPHPRPGGHRGRGSWSWCATPASPWRWAAPAASGCASASSSPAAAERELRALAELA